MPVDIIEDQDEMAGYTHGITLWRRKWEEFDDTNNFVWEIYPLCETERGNIPQESGIYTLLIQPGIARHPACSYLMYVGKTNSLRQRFVQYLTRERRETGRPTIYRLLKKYPNHAKFCFTRIPVADLNIVEKSLLVAYTPPANRQFPAEISRIVGAFR